MPTPTIHHSRLRSLVALSPRESRKYGLRSEPKLSVSPTALLECHPLDQQRQGELSFLREKQRWLQNRLDAMIRHQMQENLGRVDKTPSLQMVPDAVEMIIYGLREELARLEAHIGSLQQ